MGIGCSKEEANSIVSKIKQVIEDEKNSIFKDFNDMDLENADVQVHILEVVNEIIKQLDQLSNELDSYTFQ